MKKNYLLVVNYRFGGGYHDTEHYLFSTLEKAQEKMKVLIAEEKSVNGELFDTGDGTPLEYTVVFENSVSFEAYEKDKAEFNDTNILIYEVCVDSGDTAEVIDEEVK